MHANCKVKGHHFAQRARVMHPNLADHLHGEECRKVIEQLQKCHADHPYRKFFGACNDLKRALNRCLHKEYKERQSANLERSRKTKEAYRKMNED